MKLYLTIAMAAIAVAFATEEDDGQYRPYLYGDDEGQYRPSGDDGRYQEISYATSPRTVLVYQPTPAVYQAPSVYQSPAVVIQAPTYKAVTPVINYNSHRIGHNVYASTLSPIYEPPVVVTTARPILYAAPVKPAIEIAQYVAPSYAKTTDQYANIVQQDTSLTDKDYRFAYQTDNGIAAGEVGGETKATGFYEYIGDDGKKYRVDYVADENGFQPIGEHIPKAL